MGKMTLVSVILALHCSKIKENIGCGLHAYREVVSTETALYSKVPRAEKVILSGHD